MTALSYYFHADSPIIRSYLQSINGTVATLPSTKLVCVVSFLSVFLLPSTRIGPDVHFSVRRIISTTGEIVSLVFHRRPELEEFHFFELTSLPPLLPLSSRYPALIDMSLLSMGKGFVGQSGFFFPSTPRFFAPSLITSLSFPFFSVGTVSSTSESSATLRKAETLADLLCHAISFPVSILSGRRVGDWNGGPPAVYIPVDSPVGDQ